MRFGSAIALAASLFAFSVSGAQAQSCGSQYTVVSGDTLSKISHKAYDNGQQWSLIFYANQTEIGEDPSMIHPGQVYRIPCPDDAEIQPASANVTETPQQPRAVVQQSGGITLVTADDYRPFTDRALPQGGLITDIVRTALTRESGGDDAKAINISWVNDWSAHLNPLLSRHAFDMGFPWFRPNCEHYNDLDDPAKFRCDTFHFSEPVFEILVLFFARSDSGFQFTSDDQIAGKRLCRPAGYFTFDLDKDGRNWVKDEKVTLLRPQTVDECFEMLQRGEVDAVALNEFTGREAVNKLQIANQVVAVEKPVSVLNLHVVIAKSHPRADALLSHVNRALKDIKGSGKYGEIIDRHLSAFWKAQGSS